MQMRIGGEETAASDDRWIAIVNPANGEEVDRVPAGTAEDIARAIDVAESASRKWSQIVPRDRGKILFRAAGRVREEHTRLAPLLTSEQGKPIKESTDEIRGFANILEFFAELSSSLRGDFITLGTQGDCLVRYEPIGVCGAVIPWNMPAIVMGWKVAPALLAGNTVVIKPSSTAPLTNLVLARILEEAGLPGGVLNVITGRGDTAGEALVSHPGLAKLSFTGSTETGSRVLALARKTMKEIVLELGGSDPMIVWKDADLDAAVSGAIRGRFYNAGQTCNAVKRLYIQEDSVERFLPMLVARTQALRVGDGNNAGIDMGPLHSASQRNDIAHLVEQVKDQGEGEEKILTGGVVPEGPVYDRGYFYTPTIVSSVPDTSSLLTDEVFGPVLPVRTFATLEEGIALANRSRFGLGASIWTRDLQVVRRVFDQVDAGIVWVNRHLTVPPEVPFGGVKGSGMGRENGIQAIQHYTRTKSLFISG
ncbi:MAG: aldehyde dehydrogenase family protein [Methanomicrobiales archaeon]|nr:aldehyde dehydrogenase family protein [Methanomicrobiales archaeon]